MVMKIEGTDVKTILSYKMQENDDVMNLCNTYLWTLHQFLLFEWRPTSNTETLKSLSKFWLSSKTKVSKQDLEIKILDYNLNVRSKVNTFRIKYFKT